MGRGMTQLLPIFQKVWRKKSYYDSFTNNTAGFISLQIAVDTAIMKLIGGVAATNLSVSVVQFPGGIIVASEIVSSY